MSENECECGNKGKYQCIEDENCYCRNCAILMNVNGAGIEEDDYHFKPKIPSLFF